MMNCRHSGRGHASYFGGGNCPVLIVEWSWERRCPIVTHAIGEGEPIMAENPPEALPPTPPTPPTPPPAARRDGRISTRTVVLIGVGLVGLAIISCVIFAGGLFAGIMGATQPVVDASDAFLTALKDGNYDRAYALSSPSLQGELQNPQGFQRVLRVNRLPLKSWTFTNRSINNQQGQVAGNGELDDGRTVTIQLQLQLTGGEWKVSAFNFQTQ
jgi:hypothetical protein